MLRFNKRYFYLTLILFLIEVLIALFIKDKFIRPFVGDVLVVVLIYYFIRAFFKIKPQIVGLSVFLFACGIEVCQYFDFVDKLGLRENRVIAIALGSVFDWKDILAYGIGIMTVLWIDKSGNRINRLGD